MLLTPQVGRSLVVALSRILLGLELPNTSRFSVVLASLRPLFMGLVCSQDTTVEVPWPRYHGRGAMAKVLASTKVSLQAT